MKKSGDQPEPASETVVVPLTRENVGADDGIRTRDPHLGKVMLYQLSHVRVRLTPYQQAPVGLSPVPPVHAPSTPVRTRTR